MIIGAEEDWATIDTPFDFTHAQVNAWGVPDGIRDEYLCRVEMDTDTGVVSLIYDAPAEHFNPALVRMYPQIWTGDKFGNAPTGNPDYPARLGGIDKINVTLDCRESNLSDDVQRNIAFEAFFHSGLPITGPGHPSGLSNKVYELMVWFSSPEAGLTPTPQPVAIVDVGGHAFKVYTKDAYIAFIAVNDITAVKEFDFMDFVHETNVLAVSGLADMIDADWLVSALEFGPEVWMGAGTLEIHNFLVEVVFFDVLNDEMPDEGMVSPIKFQTGMLNLLERKAHNHILISERHRDIADDISSFILACKNDEN